VLFRSPTLATEDAAYWESLTLTSGGSDLFDENHKSTSYYISDGPGHRLFSVGTLCPSDGATKECWEDLPDGEYVVRFGGALNLNNDHTFSFCKIKNPLPKQTQLMVRVNREGCEVLSWASRAAYCSRLMDTVLTVTINLYMQGVATEITTENSALAMKEALSIVLSGVSDVRVVGAEGQYVSFDVSFSSKESGYDFSEVASIDTFEANLQNVLTTKSRTISSALLSTSLASPLNSNSGIEFSSMHFSGATEVPLVTVDAPLVAAVIDQKTQSSVTSSSSSSSLYSIIAIAGFLVAGVAAVGLVALSLSKGRTPPSPAATPSVEDALPKVEKSRVSTLTAADLRKLIASEDEALRVLTNQHSETYSRY